LVKQTLIIWHNIILLVIGALIGILPTYFGAVLIAKKNRRLDANATLYEAFHETLMSIEKQNLNTTETDSLVRKDIEKQISAVQRFKFQLNKRDRAAFLAAWEAYEHDCRAAKFTALGPEDRSRREKARNLALYRLYNILRFADYERDSHAQSDED
jgi:hypothetical protein